MLGLDIDGVVADFLSPFLLLLEKRTGKGPIPADSLVSIDFTAHPALTEEAVEACADAVKRDPGFWTGLDSLLSREQWRRLEALNRRKRLSFITHRSGGDGCDIRAVTAEWLQRHGITEPAVFFTDEPKSGFVEELGVALFVDDNYENCREVAEKTGARVMMPHHPYNRTFSHPRVRRITHFDEVFAQLPKGGVMGIFSRFWEQQEKSELEQALSDCRGAALDGYRIASRHLDGIKADTEAVSADLKRSLSEGNGGQANADEVRLQLRKQLQQAVSELDQLPRESRAALKKKHANLRKFSIALFGRTMAGKSTLMEILTGGDGASIGKGGQRTTRDVRSYEWNGLTVTDVPGIAAFEGRDDEELAFEAAAQADLVLFLITDDAPQDEEAKCLARIRALGKPVLGILNVKEALHNADDIPLLERKFDPERLGAIVEQFHELADRYGPGAPIRFFYAHLRAKFLSLQPAWELQKEELESVSRFSLVEEEIASAVIDRGSFLRWKSFIDVAVCPMIEVSDKLLEFSAQNSSGSRVLMDKARQVETWSGQFRKTGEERIDTFIAREMNALRAEIPAFVEDNYEEPKAGEHWQSLVERRELDRKAQKLLERLQEECREELSDSTRQLKAELDFVGKFAGDRRISMDSIFDAKRTWNWFSTSLSSGLGIAFLIFAGVPLGWVVGLWTAVILAGLLVPWLFQFKDRKEEAQKQRAELKGKLESDVERIESELKDKLHDCFSREILDKQVHAHIGELSTINSNVSTLADAQRRLARKLNEQQKDLHRALLDKALGHLEREDCGSLALDVARLPGQALLLPVEPGTAIPEEVRSDLEKLLGERVRYAFHTQDKAAILAQAVGRGCNPREVRIEPDTQTAHVPVDDLDADGISRIRLAQQLTELYVTKSKGGRNQ